MCAITLKWISGLSSVEDLPIVARNAFHITCRWWRIVWTTIEVTAAKPSPYDKTEVVDRKIGEYS